MKTTWCAVSLLAVAASVSDARAFTGGSPIGPESQVWITGSSNIRSFTCRARTLAGGLELRAVATRGSLLVGENAASVPSLSVPVDRIDCGNSAMNRHLRETLRSTQHPIIEFRMTTYAVDLAASVPTAGIVGHVTIGGVQRPVTATASIRADSLGVLHVLGTYVVRMTDFGITPPRRFGGLLRARDHIAVHFDIAPAADGGAIDEIVCSLMPYTEPKLEAPDAWHP